MTMVLMMSGAISKADALRPAGETAQELFFLGIARPAAFHDPGAAQHALTMMREGIVFGDHALQLQPVR